jgi:hypothetical protein
MVILMIFVADISHAMMYWRQLKAPKVEWLMKDRSVLEPAQSHLASKAVSALLLANFQQIWGVLRLAF